MEDNEWLAIPAEVIALVCLSLLAMTETLFLHAEIFQRVKEMLDQLLSVMSLHVLTEEFHVGKEAHHVQSHHPEHTSPAVLLHPHLAVRL